MEAKKKTIRKSIRLSEENFQYVNCYSGNTFTDRLENMIQDYANMNSLESMHEELFRLYQERDRLKKDISALVEFKTSLDGLREQFADTEAGTAQPMA